MKLIGNEIKYCEKHIRNNTIDDNVNKTVVIMIKYFYLVHEMTKAEIKENILGYLQNVGEELEETKIDSLIKTNTSSKTTLNTLESISISSTEWEYIQTTGRSERERKVLFTLLCMYKIKVGLGFADDKTVKVEYTTLNREAHVTLTKASRIDMLRHFTSVGAISMGMGHLAKKVKLHYVDNKDVLIEITEFDSLNVYYDHLKKGGRLIICQHCGNLVLLKKSKSPSKYCEECSRKKQLEHKRNYKNKN